MSDKVKKKRELAFETAVNCLTSEEVSRFAVEKRKHYQYIVRESRLAERGLEQIVKQAADAIVPLLIEIEPRKPSLLAPYGLNLVRPWLSSYLSEFAFSKRPTKSLARKWARALVEEAIKKKVQLREVTPLVNFSCAREFSIGSTISGRKIWFRIKKHDPEIDARSLGFFFVPSIKDFTFDFRLYDVRQPYEWVLIVETSMSRTKKFLGDEVRDIGHLTNAMITALNLFKDGQLQAPQSYQSDDSIYMAGSIQWYSRPIDILPIGDIYHLSEDDISTFRMLWKSLAGLVPYKEKLPPRIATAIRYFISSSSKRLDDRFLDLSIALESLFGIVYEVSYRLPLRVSVFLWPKGSLAVEMYESIRNLWRIRNLIVHGNWDINDAKRYRELEKRTPELRRIVRKSILEHIELFASLGYDKKLYGEHINDFEKIHLLNG